MPDTSDDMAKTKQYTQVAQLRLLKGTFEGIDAVLREGEERPDFIREAIDHYVELRRQLVDGAETDPKAGIELAVTTIRDALAQIQVAEEVARTALARVRPLGAVRKRQISKPPK